MLIVCTIDEMVLWPLPDESENTFARFGMDVILHPLHRESIDLSQFKLDYSKKICQL